MVFVSLAIQGFAGAAKEKAGDAAHATQEKAQQAKEGTGNAFQQVSTISILTRSF